MNVDRLKHMDLIDKIKKDGELILRYDFSDYNRAHYTICLSSDKVPSHKGRRCYYLLEVDKYGEQIYYNYKTIKPIVWYRKMVAWKAITKLQLLVETGRSVNRHLMMAFLNKDCLHECKINEHNQYEISNVTEGHKTGTCEHCGNQITIVWYVDFINSMYSGMVMVFCKNGCWITDRDTKKAYQEFMCCKVTHK